MTSEFDVAVHALVFLNRKGIPLSSEIIASNVCTNPARIRKVMSKLRRANLVRAKEGIDGGYQLEKTIEEISLFEIATAVETVLISARWKTGDVEKSCLVASGMASVMAELYDDLNTQCMERLKLLTLKTVDEKLFFGSLLQKNKTISEE